MKPRALNRSSKLKIYKSLIRPIWMRSLDFNKPRFLENQNELRAERPNKKRRYSEICKKSKIMAWLGHVMRMEGKRIHKRVLEWEPTGRRNRGRPRKRWI